MLSRETIDKIVECRLPEEQIRGHLESITSDRIDAPTLAAFLDALRDTLSQEAQALADITGTIDCSGTGGSGLPHFNVSTTVAFVLAAGGQKVAKCGNRASAGRSGSFDLLECLGVPSNLPPSAVRQVLHEAGVAFLFVQQYYPGLAKLAPIRKSLGKRTIFNIIGPLLNPIKPVYRVMGVSCPSAQECIAQYLVDDRVVRRTLLVRSDNGLDELETDTNCTIFDVMQGCINRCHVRVPSASKDDDSEREKYQFTPQENYRLFLDIISGRGPDWLTELVCLNAAAGFLACGCSNLESSMDMAMELVRSGQVAEKVEQCRRAYGRFAS